MVDEILSSFQDELFGAYDAVLSATTMRGPRSRGRPDLFEAIDPHRDEVAIFQNEAATSAASSASPTWAERNTQSRDVWITLLDDGVRTGRCAPTSTSSSPIASSVTPCGSRSGGTAPAAS